MIEKEVYNYLELKKGKITKDNVEINLVTAKYIY